MPKKPVNILSIDPGYKFIGYAAFEGTHLVDYGVRSIIAPQFASALSQVEEFLVRFISQMKPTAVVFEKSQFSQIQVNYRVTQVCARIESVCKHRRIPAYAINARTVRKAVCKNGNATKAELARAVAARFVETRMLLKGRNKTQDRYFQNAFDAIACGLAFVDTMQSVSPHTRWRIKLGGKR